MKFDTRLLTGIFVGAVLGLHYHDQLVVYSPLLIIATLIMLLRTIHH